MMSVTDQPETKRKSPRLLRWLVLATVLVLVSAGALTLWIPYHDRQKIIAEFQKRGGVVTTQSGGPKWLRNYFEPEQLTMFDEVAAVNLVKSNVTDTDIELLLEFPKIQGLSLYGPEMTDAGLLRLQKLSDLHTLMLVNCPKLTAQAIADFQTACPSVSVVRRGNALLGIAGETVPAGCQILTVASGLAAHNAGLRSGDIITKLDDQPVTGYESLTDLLLTRQPGEKIKVTVQTPSSPSAVMTRTVVATLSAWR
jgi:hypothetical protein